MVELCLAVVLSLCLCVSIPFRLSQLFKIYIFLHSRENIFFCFSVCLFIFVLITESSNVSLASSYYLLVCRSV